MFARLTPLSLIAALLFGSLQLTSCSSPAGTRVKTPFSGKKYMSDARYFRAVGMGQSTNLNIAKNKAELESRKALAQQVQTNLKVVTDNYAQEMVGNQAAEAIERFETLSREVTNTTIGDLRQLGQDIRQLEDQTYVVYVAIEVKKKAMFKFLKNKAKSDAKISELVRAQMVMVLDKEIERLESEE
jgi:septal ring factor EnvC (AmiA/AmiB activator)